MKYLKFIYITLIIFLLNVTLNAQNIELQTIIMDSYSMTFHNNYLYSSGYQKILKVNTLVSNSTPEIIVQGTDKEIYGQIAFYRNYIYASVTSKSKIIKIDS